MGLASTHGTDALASFQQNTPLPSLRSLGSRAVPDLDGANRDLFGGNNNPDPQVSRPPRIQDSSQRPPVHLQLPTTERQLPPEAEPLMVHAPMIVLPAL